MSDKGRRRDLWKQAPSGSEGDAAKDFEPAAGSENDATEEGAPEEQEPRGYEPKHRAPGRAPLIRRRRARVGDEETVAWETPWTEPSSDPPPRRWTDEEEPSINPPARPREDVPYLAPRRSELRRKRSRSLPDASDVEPSTPTREYTGRHLAPKKGRWTRGSDEEVETTEPNGIEDPSAEPALTADDPIVEGDVERPDEISPNQVARPDRSAEDDLRREIARLQAEAAESDPGDAEAAPEPSGTEVASDPSPTAAVVGSATDVLPAGTDETTDDPATKAAGAPATPLSVPEPPPTIDLTQLPDPTFPQLTLDANAADTPADTEDSGDGDEVGKAESDDDTPAGPRRAALEERKKKKRVLQGGVAVLALIAATAAVVGAGLLVKEAVDEPSRRAAVPFDQPKEERVGGTTLVFGTREKGDNARGALWMLLLNVDPETEKASIVYIPAHTAVEVPGRGLQGVGQAYGSGGIPLLLVSAENLLGMTIDRYVELSDRDALVLFEQFDTLTVDVPAEVRVPAGRDQARLIFVEGPQQMTPSALVRLLYTTGIDGDDVELGSRHLAFWDELLDVYRDPAELAAAFEEAGAALGDSDVAPEELAEFMAELAATPSEAVTITALPVRPISAGDSELYSVDAAELTAFIEDSIGPTEGGKQEVRVQLLNGNGVPGIGRQAAAKLVGEGFRVILGGNARRLDYRKTLVIAYDSSDRGVGVAERARDLLGVGQVQVSAQEQGIVDLTIVVGKDFLRAQ